MGVHYDYFTASDDAAAAATIDLSGGPAGPVQLPMPFGELVKKYGREGAREFTRPKLHQSEHGFHAVSTKGFDPFIDLPSIEESLTGQSPDDSRDPVAMRDEGERLVLRLEDSTREEQAIDPDPAPITHLVKELAALAQGAVERGENLYCWVCV